MIIKIKIIFIRKILLYKLFYFLVINIKLYNNVIKFIELYS